MARPVIPEVNVQEEVNAQTTTRSNHKSFDEIVNELRQKDGAKVYHNLRIKSVKVTEKDTHTMVSFTVDKFIPGRFYNEDTNQWDMGESNVIYSSTVSISALMKEDDDLAAIANVPTEHPERLLRMFAGGELVVLQEPVVAGEYINPFSTKSKVSVLANDTVINHLIGIKLGKYGQLALSKMTDMMFLD